MKFVKYLLYVLPLLAFAAIATYRELGERELGSRSNPVKIYFTPSVDAQKISMNAYELTDFLEKETGYHFTSSVPSSFVAVVEAFGSGKADIALINTFSYLMAREKYGATARLRIVRDNNEANYQGQIITRTDAGIDDVRQLNGKTMAYVDPSSTSGYILPKALLDSLQVEPSEVVFAMKHDNVVTMVYQGQVDAGATFYSPPDPATGRLLDARGRVLTQFPDVGEKIKILALSEEIPNDPLVFSSRMHEAMKEQIIHAMLKYLATPAGAEVFYRISDVKALRRTTDADYDVLRNILRRLKIDVSGGRK